MKKLKPWHILLIVVVAVFAFLIIERYKSNKAKSNIGKNDSNNFNNTEEILASGACLPCSSVEVEQLAFRVVDDPNVCNFRTGRSTNPSNAQARYNGGQNRVTLLCHTDSVEESKIVERRLNGAVIDHPKCDNVANDARGKTPKKDVITFIYVKSISCNAEIAS